MQIHDYARVGDIEGVQRELAAGADINAIDAETGQTPLAEAAGSAQAGLAMLGFLLDAGADINFPMRHGYDVLIYAVCGHGGESLLTILRFLIERGAPLNGVSDYNESALRITSRCARFDAVRLLLDAGADPKHLEWTGLMDMASDFL